MGVGKSTTGIALAAELEMPYVDSDRVIEQLMGRSGRQVAETHGVPALHRLEAAVLLGPLTSTTPMVITAAASTVEDELVCEALGRRAYVVRLVAPLDTMLERQGADDHRRPMASAELAALAERREPMFASVERLCVDADQETATIIAMIVAGLESEGILESND